MYNLDMNLYTTIILLNDIILNYFLLSLTAIVMQYDTKISRLAFAVILSSLTGVLYPIVMYMQYAQLFNILSSFLVVSVLFIHPTIIQSLKATICLFLFTSTLYGALSYVFPNYMDSSNTALILLIFAVMYTITYILLNHYKIDKQKRKNITNIIINHGNRSINVQAYLDSGLTLIDPLDNSPVIFVKPEIIYQLFNMDIDDILSLNTSPLLPNRHKINATTINQSSLITVFKIDSITIQDTAQKYKNISVSIIYDNVFTQNCQALLHNNMI